MKSKNNTNIKSAANASDRVSGSYIRLNKVLVPIDFSSRSKNALQYGIHFAKQFNASLVLLHVLTRPAVSDPKCEDEWKLRLKAWTCEFVPNQIPVQIEVARGAEALEIVNAAKHARIDLMIISTHGRVGRAHALAGSLADRLVQLAPCPVLVIHEQEHGFIETPEFQASLISQDGPAGTVEETLAPKWIGADI